ncbi:hypothetical protein V490_08579 [Pseudogymnoascus sp. VKM F-3557]|nr:hypothetical protein V490_08579 [Pseudogymnoascus sp. VKM F-3557]
MEGLGAAAAADQLLKEAFKLVQLIRAVRDKYKGAPKEIEAWRQEIEDFTALIKSIEELPTLDGYGIDTTIERCRTICRDLTGIFGSLDFAATDPRLHKTCGFHVKAHDGGLTTWMAIKGIDQEPVVKKYFEELQRFKETLQLKINVSQLKQGHQTAQDVQFIKTAIQPGSEEDRCLKSLFITNPTDDRDAIITAKGVRIDGTCEWITSTNEYKTWIASPPSLLWLSGGPGKGKTFLSIFLTKSLSESAHVIYFFCDNKNASRNTAVAILRGLLYQLVGQYPQLLRHVLTPWKIQQDALFNSNSFESLWRIFQTMLEDLGTDLICVLDGLDECADDSLESLLRKTKILFTENLERHKLRLIILSRRHPDCLERVLGSFARIDLDSDQVSNRSDINSCITSRVAQLAKRKGISTSLIQHIEEIFQEKSEDTFLWVSFMADDLEKQTVPGIEKALQTLPKGLDEVYERILQHIKPENTAIIATMLKWISLAERPLSVPELAEAIQIHESNYMSKEELCLSYIESCGHLLQISLPRDADNDELSRDSVLRVTFVHQSVKDFLFGLAKHRKLSAFQVEKAQDDLDIASQLLSSMQNEWLKCVQDEQNMFKLQQGQMDAYPLAHYAVWNWNFHLLQLQDKKFLQLIDRNQSFFSDSSDIRDMWLDAKHLSGGADSLRFACEFGLTTLAKRSLERRKRTSPFTFSRYVNNRRYPESSLFLAMVYRNFALIQLLLSYNVKIEIPCSGFDDRNALQCTTEWGELEIFQLFEGKKSGKRIIDADIKASQRGVKRDSLLHLAARSGNSQMCSYLIERYHYNVEVVGAWGQTPICNAICGKSIGLAREFVEQWGASIADAGRILKAVANPPNSSRAEGSGEELDVVISEWKIDINTRDKYGQTILHLEFKRLAELAYSPPACHEFAAHCLMLGADPSVRATNGDAPFHLYRWFAQWGASSLRPVILLLRDGRLGVNDQGNGGNTLLHKFVHDAFNNPFLMFNDTLEKNGTFNALTSLLDVGADRTLVNSQEMTALQLAKMICDSGGKTSIKRTEDNIRILADIVDVLDNYATVSNQPLRLDPLDWAIQY